MQQHNGSIQLSASDLVGYLGCRHLARLELGAARGHWDRPVHRNAALELLWTRGLLHEQAYVAHLRTMGLRVVELQGDGVHAALVDQTIEAMKGGADVIIQGALKHDAFVGRPDVLRRIQVKSVFGDWSYEALDTKLARETKGGAVLQLSLYSDLLSHAQGCLPASMHVVVPGPTFETQSFSTAAYSAYYRYIKKGLEAASLDSNASTYPDPVAHCDICRWWSQCDDHRRRDDHLCLVAGVTKLQTTELTTRDVTTMTSLATLPVPLAWKPKRGVKESYERAREQARVQVAAKTGCRPIFETIAPAPNIGLARLPTPSPGDVFFDLEGDPFVGPSGIEYLFGYVIIDDVMRPTYVSEWALTREQEKHAFERFVDFVMDRWETHPDMHIYHYAPYEPSALKRLMGRFATKEEEVDQMLRGRLFVDLHTVVRQGIRAGVESYSIKNLEVFYELKRDVALEAARPALNALQSALELNDTSRVNDEVLGAIAGYNRDDCISALKLRDWLEGVRSDLVAAGASIERPSSDIKEPSEELDARQQRIAELIGALTHDVPLEIKDRSVEQHARWILAYTLDWHRREQKSVWWEFYRLADLTVDDLVDERDAITGLAFKEAVDATSRAPIHRYTFPFQETQLRGGEDLFAPGGAPMGKVDSISIADRTVDIKKRMDMADVHPTAVFAHDSVDTDVLADALVRIGGHVAKHGLGGDGEYRPACELLLNQRIELGGEALRQPGESATQSAVRIAAKLNGGVLPIQGPPGAGKTFTASRMICALVASGKKVGITANSHKVIRNLLDRVVEAADEQDVPVQCVQKISEKRAAVHRIQFAKANKDVYAALRSGCNVAAGTAWLWAHEDASECVDVLFVDEAAQMSLANVLAVSQSCKTLVLVGDPQQLQQPTKGSHPEGTGVSALEHILQGGSTIDDERGLFLEETWRLHPAICSFTSEMFYAGRLNPRAGLEDQIVTSTSRLAGHGLRYLPVSHQGNQSVSLEEAVQIEALVNEVLSSGATWIDRQRKQHVLTLNDILIIAPYNAQVFELQARLPGARVGTVDKFQGQEAPIVIYSLTTSSQHDAPRGMEFLYSLNRLNVATSRAQCICVLVGSPNLFGPECRTPEQMRMANALCRYLELAIQLDGGHVAMGQHA